MTSGQIDLISKTQSIKTIFTDTEYDRMPPEIRHMVRNQELDEKLNAMNLKTNLTNLTDADLLQFAMKNGTIDLGIMLGEIDDMNRKELLSQHKYAITHEQMGHSDIATTK